MTALPALPALLLPPDEAGRLAALARYSLLDNRSERLLDEVVALTARIFGVSNAMLSIVEANTVLVKAPYHLPVPVERVPREQSICSATILGHQTVVYEDLRRVVVPGVDTSLVLSLGLHFYAGHNLTTADSYAIGSLCIYDGTPRPFSAPERELLGVLADLVMQLLDLRLALGAHVDTSFVLWEPVYGAIGGQMARLTALAGPGPADGETPAAPPVTAALLAQARSIAGLVQQFVEATAQRVK